MNPTPPHSTASLHFGGEDAHPCGYGDARVAVLPVPYEGTVSYGQGASRGPAAILAASGQLEMYDEELDCRIDLAGLHTLPPLEFAADQTPAAVLAAIRAAALPPFRDGKLLATLGGEHSLTPAVLTALLEARAGRPFSVLQLDAHADLRPSYQGSPHNHACVMARVRDLNLPAVQVGIRSLSAPERALLRAENLEQRVFWGNHIAAAADHGWMDQVVALLGEEVYVTVDLDALDPSIMPATGTPEPGGLDWRTTTALLQTVAAQRRVLGFDLTELAPIAGLHAPDFLAARLAFKMIGYALRLGPEG